MRCRNVRMGSPRWAGNRRPHQGRVCERRPPAVSWACSGMHGGVVNPSRPGHVLDAQGWWAARAPQAAAGGSARGPVALPGPGDGPYAEGRMLLRAAAQARWLARDLAAVDRARTPWVLVTFHNPWRARRTLPCIDNCACGVWRISKGSLWGVQMVQPACPWDGPRGAVRHEREAGQYGVRRSVRRLHDALCCQPGAPWCHARVRPSRELSGLALPPGALRPVGRCSPAR